MTRVQFPLKWPRGTRLMALAALLFLLGPTIFSRASQAEPAHAQTPMWIWAATPGKTPETVFFRHHFRLPQGITSAKLAITADDAFKITINESKRPVFQGADWTTVQEVDVSRNLKAGDNLFAIECVNTSGVGGLIYRLTARNANGDAVTVVSSGDARFSRSVPPTWAAAALDDSKWPKAKEIAPANGGLWGQLYLPLQPDPTRMVRLWDIRAGGKPGENPYSRQRNIGDRMLLSANTTSAAEMDLLAQCGFSLFQSDSDHLSTEETRPNVWDFAGANAARATVQRLGLDWCYFPHEAFPPAWYRQTVPFTRLQCLEHNQPVEAFSIWDPKWPEFIDRGYAAMEREFAARPAPQPPGQPERAPGRPGTSVSTLYVGVHGDYGECGLMMGARVTVPGQKEEWGARFGNLHDHLGWWCADALARADFRAAMLRKYGTLAALNKAWKRELKTPDEIAYPAAPRPEARREWLDFVGWYQESVGHAIELNLDAARRHFPDTLLMLPAGFGDENPRGGNDNSLIPKIAAKYKADVRSTHGAFHPFAENAATMFGRLGSACRFYDVPFWSEPPTTISANQEVERIFESVSQGAKGQFDWTSSALKHRDVYLRYGKFLRVGKPLVDVAMFYPAEAQKTRPNEGYANLFAQACGYVRDIANFDIVDDRMVMDGCLANYRILALWEGTTCDQATLDKIKAWVNDGGVLLAYDFGKVTNFEGEAPWYADDSELFGYVQHLMPATIRERYAGAVPAQYRIAVADPNAPTAADYLADGGDGWYAPDTADDGIARRWTRASASVLLPIKPDTDYTLIVRASVPKEAAGKKRIVAVNDHDVGELEATGDVTYRFVLPASVLGGQRLSRVTFRSETFALPGDTRPLGVQIQYVQLVQRGEEENARAPLPPGAIRREMDFAKLKTDWTRKLGKGLTIYFPANKRLLKGYIEVLRRAIYRLSDIEPGRTDALPIDDALDGLYTTLFTDQILFYNSKDKAVTKTLHLDPDKLEAWKGQITMPRENTWTVTVPAHGIEAIRFTPPAEELIYECEEFLELNNLKPLNAPECSPGTGKTCVVLPKGSEISTTVQIETPGSYAVFSRCTRAGKPETPEIAVDDQPIKAIGTRNGQTTLCGVVNLGRGKHTLTLRARPDRDIRADFVVLTNDSTIAGYDFFDRRPAFER
ncbi:MAG TPA: hypothetical protein VKT77_13560 [Chthonomonadaceae bacterium]|nr:hypothetical protein [Chthonomonadaceae bacterium]